MPITPYAAPADLTAWLPASIVVAAPEATRLLGHATRLIDKEMIGSSYNTDVNGMPTDAPVIQAFNDAACAQVEYWLENGDEFGDGEHVQGYTIEGATVQFSKPPPRLAPRARDVLRIAGLLPSQTPIHMP